MEKKKHERDKERRPSYNPEKKSKQGYKKKKQSQKEYDQINDYSDYRYK